MQQVFAQRIIVRTVACRCAPAAVMALGGSGAAHRMYQNERPPLPGRRRDTCCIQGIYRNSVYSGIPLKKTLMHAAKRPRTLEATVTAKHTFEEEKRIKEAAERAALTVSEWCRQTHLQALEMPRGERILLEEIMALRRIILMFQKHTSEAIPLNEDRFRFVVEDAEAHKNEMAEKRINDKEARRG